MTISRTRRQHPGTLRALLRWAHQSYVSETPNLDHSSVHLDDDGAPTMAAAARRYLGLSEPQTCPKCRRRFPKHEPGCRWKDRRDDWLDVASRTDPDGFYLTPLRRAIEVLPAPRRLFLRDLVPELFFPTEVALLHDIPAWCVSDVIHESLSMLWGNYRERPEPRAGWLERSDAQRAAEATA